MPEVLSHSNEFSREAACYVRLHCFSEWRHSALCASLAAWLDMAICARYHEACQRAFRMGDTAWQKAI